MKDTIIKLSSDKGSTKLRRSLGFIIVQFWSIMTRWYKFLNKPTEKQRTVWTQESGDTKHSFDQISHAVNLSHYLCLDLFLIFLRKRDGKTPICYVAVATCWEPFPESISCPWCSSHTNPISCRTGKLRSALGLIHLCVCVCGCVWVSPRAHPLCFLKLEQTVASHTWLPVWRGSRKQFTQRRTQPREFVWLYWVCDSDKFILSRLTAGRGGESGWVMGSINRKHPHLENDCK